MAWRYKASKYKNAAPKFPKKEEIISGLPVKDVGISFGNHIKSSCVYVAFNTTDLGGAGGSVGYLPLSTKGRQNGSSIPTIQASSEFISDFDFSPFDDYLLATGSHDSNVKLWSLPDESSPSNQSEPVLSFSNHGRRVGNVQWNPAADGILAVSADSSLNLFDVGRCEAASVFCYSGYGDVVQSLCWKGDGSLLSTTSKDKKVRVIDPRANQVVQEGQAHDNNKDSRVLWLGNSDFLLTTGFTMSRSREYAVWDPRNLKSSLNRTALGSSNGTVMPLYDMDTNMTFLIGKGDNSLNYVEFTEKSPYLTQANVSNSEQVKGACLVPKRAMTLMDAEVNRLLLLCQDAIIPVSYIVPRKNYREFHDDIFPNTKDGIPGCHSSQWLQGDNSQPATVQLHPDATLLHKERKGALFTTTASPPLATNAVAAASTSTPPEPSTSSPSATTTTGTVSPPHKLVETTSTVNQVEEKKDILPPKPSLSSKPAPATEKPQPPPKVHKPFHKTRQSKYRYIQGKLEHSSCYTTNLRNLSKSMPGETNMFAINQTRCVVCLDGAGGCLQVVEFSKASRLPDTGNPVLQNGSKVTDFSWDPFDESRLIVGLDSAKLNVWKIPSGGLVESMDEATSSLWGHQDKILFISFHPLASDIVATGSLDETIKVWDLTEEKDVITLEGHQDQIFCFGWSQSGSHCATVCRDGKVRIYEPRKGTSPIKEGVGPEGQRGARVVWALQDQFLVVSGFDKSSRQQIRLYRTEDLQCVDTVELETMPSILVPHYDPDCSLLYLTSRGERTIKIVDVFNEEPFLTECAPFRMDSLHQAAAYLPKKVCDVRKLQVAKGWRLTANSVEAMTFTVPRVKPQYFQDDLYPPTTVSGKPSMTSAEWLSGKNVVAPKVSLCPPDMQPLSQAPTEAPKPKKFESYNVETFKTDEQKKDELLSAMVGKLEIKEEPMPQDLAEGVDDDEWDD